MGDKIVRLRGEHKIVKISELKEHPKNPKTISRTMLKKLIESIERLGYIIPIIVNRDNVILDGHQRIKAMKKMGVESVEVLVIENESELEDLMALLVSDMIYGEIDQDSVGELLEFLEKEGEDIGYLVENSENMQDYVEPPPLIEDDGYTVSDNIPSVDTGDMFIIHTHNAIHILACADSTDEDTYGRIAQIMSEHHVGPVRIIFADPPYDAEPEDIYTSAHNMLSISSDPHIFYMAYDQQLNKLMQIEDSHFRSFLVFRTKSQIREGMYYYRRHILVAHYVVGDGPIPYHNLMEGTETMVELPYRRTFPDKVHEYQKPIEPISYFLRPYIEPNITIGDPYAGTGTTLILADKLSCNSVCIDIDPKMIAIALDRVMKYDESAEVVKVG